MTSASGLVLLPTTTFDDCPALDVLCVPGGVGVDAVMGDAESLAFVRGQAAGARYLTSVCTGALVLGAAGLLAGRRATTHWASHDLLSAFGAIPTRGRVVRDGNLLTGGGVTAGIDLGLTVAAELVDRAAAEAVQLELEYAPAPPYDAGSPETAPPAVLATMLAKGAEGHAKRRAIIDGLTRRDPPKDPNGERSLDGFSTNADDPGRSVTMS